MQTIGVSPAYFISRYGESFSPRNVADGLALLKQLGYDTFQLEVFDPATLDEWAESGADMVAAEARRLGLAASQFVAHFLLHGFVDAEAAAPGTELEAAEKIVKICSRFQECRVVTLPMGPFRPERMEGFRYDAARRKIGARLGALAQRFEASGLLTAVELIPGGFLTGTDGLAGLLSELSPLRIGYNFDTGHANACKENVAIVPYRLEGRLYGTHLCDNSGNENLSLCPSEGNIDWDGVFKALNATGYTGSLDVEIRCEPGQTEEKYAKAAEVVRAFRAKYPRAEATA